MSDVGLRELRQHASDVVRRAETGETITITVAGRPAATLGPPSRDSWRRFDEIAEIFSTPTDPHWQKGLHHFDDSPRDPWEPSTL
jgi:prevent-host-death family protein